MCVNYTTKDKCIEKARNLKFLGIQIDNHLNWRNHIDQIIPKLSVAPYVYWTVHHYDSSRIKDQLDVTCYFIPLLMCSTCFGH